MSIIYSIGLGLVILAATAAIGMGLGALVCMLLTLLDKIPGWFDIRASIWKWIKIVFCVLMILALAYSFGHDLLYGAHHAATNKNTLSCKS